MAKLQTKKPPPSYGDGFMGRRRGWDLNPRGTYAPAGFQDRSCVDATNNHANGLQPTTDSSCTDSCTPKPEATLGLVAASSASETLDPDLSCVTDAWPTLPPHLKAAILALVAVAPKVAR